ncbi:MAG: OmpA family protein [Deltaproteobacteria bacterium]|nr:OmpA family protein [Deltaproteobacteria bacterium]
MKRISLFAACLSIGFTFLFSSPCLSESSVVEHKSKNGIQEPDINTELPALQIKAGQLGIVGIHFESGSSGINKCFTTQLNQIANALKTEKLRNAKILIRGHSDNKGPAKYNLKLSRLRAKRVMDILIEKYKIDENRLTSEGVGETMPISSNDTESGQALNRRIEFIYLDEPDPKTPE